MSLTELPLRYRTPDSWAASATSNMASLLSDHAYLERKAATNALDLLNRWPEPNHPEQWVSTLSSIARDETAHLNSITRLMRNRGGKLERTHRSRYAGDLRLLVRKGLTPEEVVDRLLTSSLIEARSCERFEILSRLCPDQELAQFYVSLHSAEMGHFTVFLSLAQQILSENEISNRWNELLDAEAIIIQSQTVGPHLHSAAPTDSSSSARPTPQ
jgi:tRNA 2-(methylsulfanyl)-N6-isopentenyladenosine37 hydroxylase